MCKISELIISKCKQFFFFFFCNYSFYSCVHTSFSTPSIQFVTILELPLLNSRNKHQCCMVKHLFSSILGRYGTKHICEAQKACYYCVFEKISLLNMDIDLNFIFNTRGIMSTDKCDAHLNICIDQHIHN